jgi:hypothetical protein
MENMKELMIQYKLKPMKIYDIIDNNVVVKYWFDNTPYDIELFMDSSDFKKLDIDINSFAEKLFDKCTLDYSNKHEFYID